MQAHVEQVLEEPRVHAAVEEELLYPAARAALDDEDLIEEVEVENELAHTLMDQLRGRRPGDDKYCARFTVLCEYVKHHVKAEEGEMFLKLESARLDWECLAAEMAERRAELTTQAEEADPVAGGSEEAAEEGSRKPPAKAAPARRRTAASRSQ